MDIAKYYSKVEKTAAWLKNRTKIRPRQVIVLSGGMDAFLNSLDEKVELDSAKIPNFPRATAEGHSGKIFFGRYKGEPVVVMKGRYHYYEGHAPQDIVFPYFVFSKMGAKFLVMTSAVGGIKKTLRPGDITIIEDHINLMGINPIRAISFGRKENQFTSLVDAYDLKLVLLAQKQMKRLKMAPKKSVYVAVSGPSYETKIEISAYRKLGASVVGMSVAPETIAANFLGMRVLAFACIANEAADLYKGRMSHAEVLSAMKKMSPKMVTLLKAVVDEITKFS